MSEAYLDRGLPPEVLAVLPAEGEQQLDLAHRIAQHAYAQRVCKLEAEAHQLQSSLMQSQQTVKALERRLAGAEAELVDQQQRARQSLSEQHKLVAEKNALIETVKRLNREVAKLEHFKRNLLQQLQEDCEADAPGSAYAAVDMTTDRLVSEVLHSADGIAAAAAAAAANAASLSATHYSQQHQQPMMGSAYQPQQQQQQHPGSGRGSWSPTAHGNMAGGAGRLQGGPGSPGTSNYTSRGYSNTHAAAAAAAAAGMDGAGGSSSPYRTVRSASSAAKESVLGSKAGIPAGSTAAAGGLMSAGAAAGHGAAAAGVGGGSGAARGLAAAANLVGPRFSSPPQAGGSGRVPGGAAAGSSRVGAATSPRIDGKEFFRQARARLSYEQFSQFLVAIKELNAGRTSREDTLGAAKALFGPNNLDLYGLFEGLLMRHLTNF